MVDFIHPMVYNLKKPGYVPGHGEAQRDNEEQAGAEAEDFSLYAQAEVAFQLGGDMLPLARRRAQEALELMAGLEHPDREEQRMAEELREQMK